MKRRRQRVVHGADCPRVLRVTRLVMCERPLVHLAGCAVLPELAQSVPGADPRSAGPRGLMSCRYAGCRHLPRPAPSADHCNSAPITAASRVTARRVDSSPIRSGVQGHAMQAAIGGAAPTICARHCSTTEKDGPALVSHRSFRKILTINDVDIDVQFENRPRMVHSARHAPRRGPRPTTDSTRIPALRALQSQVPRRRLGPHARPAPVRNYMAANGLGSATVPASATTFRKSPLGRNSPAY